MISLIIRSAPSVLALAVIAAACSEGSEPPGTISPALSPSAGAPAAPEALPVGPLEPGTYVTEDFPVALTLTVGDGWSAVNHDGRMVALAGEHGTLTFGIAVDPDAGAFQQRLHEAGIAFDGPEVGTLDTVPTERFLLDPAEGDVVLYRTADGPFRILAGNAATVDVGETPAGVLVVVTQAPQDRHVDAQAASDTVLATVTVAA